MAVTVADLISQRDKIKGKRKDLYDLETSIGTIVVKQPTAKVIDETLKIEGGGRQSDIELVLLNPILRIKICSKRMVALHFQILYRCCLRPAKLEILRQR